MELKWFYRDTSYGVKKVLVLEEDGDQRLVAEITDMTTVDQSELYKNKQDIHYKNLLRKLKDDPSASSRVLKRYKSSPYYQYYMDKLIEDYPEFII